MTSIYLFVLTYIGLSSFSVIKGKLPKKAWFALWFLLLVFGPVFYFFLKEIAFNYQLNTSLSLLFLFWEILLIIILLLTIRNEGSYHFKIHQFKIDNKIFFILLYSILPMFNFHNPVIIQENHPLIKDLIYFIQNKNVAATLVMVILIGFTTAIFEELLFRGILCKKLESLKKHYSEWGIYSIISIFFGFLHAEVLSAFLFSLILFYLKKNTSNLLPGIIAHLFWNTSICIKLIITYW